ncbi:uncharacterized protein PITG_02906 [Phytophthora infestans T30-4]|uniref:Transmembrane protein n=2 Tax=Phytophthora infestans TaxID=4787 RepID=D0MXH0_PHYIT|nr:uncharacterized protein PITG_02906 [Phytophthora infestans T30-4]EEY64333.1 conserved hypothetical protein [Phytophthora infestans T30-4]KAF4136580.1 hypothetical protein GN958_ATG14255 [Phytophthora infestans]KAI9986250.1 hypothetical protein PInf_025176 [Phytophthora infestans]|eukprot:XP_002907769.1 conserved hypothetical protein [Phytophthora infestans T30-4]
MRPLYVRVLDHVLRRSFGHPLSVQLLALSSLVLLLSVLMFSLDPWLDDNSHQYMRRLAPSINVQFDSFAVDHLVVFGAISPPLTWLLLVHVAYSQIDSRVEAALLILRVASCLTVTFALTVLLTEFLSRRAMLALVALVYASLGLLYSWSVPIWKWYQEEMHTRGLVGFLPDSMQELLLRTSLLEWLTDTSFSDKVAPFLPFLLPLTRAEQMKLMEQMPPESQVMMTKPGLLPLLPDSVQNVLLPAAGSDSDQDEAKQEESQTSEEALTIQETEEIRVVRMQQRRLLTLTPPTRTMSGFDFHRPEVVDTVRTPPSREQALNEIVASRMWNGCKELVKLPSSKTLNRTAAMSSALLVMQLYASKGSRKVFLTFAQLVAASALSSVACCAIFLRFVQLLDLKWTSGRTMPLLRYARQYLLRNGNGGTPQISDQPANGASVALRTAASSVSIVMAALYVLRKLRR